MLTINDRKNAAGTKEYFSAEERIEGQEAIPPRWMGIGAALRHGLEGIAERFIFNRMVDNKTPDGTGKITPRRGENSVVLQELVFNCPKGVSVAAAFTGAGKAIEQAFIESVNETVNNAVEPLAATRVRVGGRMEDRVTGEVTGTLYTHSVSRSGDPHLHGHLGLQNHTWDRVEGRFKALKAHDIHKSAPEIQAYFHKTLRQKITNLGFETRKQGQFWDIAGISRHTLEKFSERRQSIKTLYAEVEAEGRRVPKKLRDKAAIMTRPDKVMVIDLVAKRKEWADKLTTREKNVFKRLQSKPKVSRGPSRNKKRVEFLRNLRHDSPTLTRERGFERT